MWAGAKYSLLKGVQVLFSCSEHLIYNPFDICDNM